MSLLNGKRECSVQLAILSKEQKPFTERAILAFYNLKNPIDPELGERQNNDYRGPDNYSNIRISNFTY